MEHHGRACSRAHLLVEIERQSPAAAAASDKTAAASAAAARGAHRLLQAAALQLLQEGLGGGGQLGDAGGILNLRRVRVRVVGACHRLDESQSDGRWKC